MATRGHLHDAPPAMAIPLILLALGSVVAGYVGVPHALGGDNRIDGFLESSLPPGARRAARVAHGAARRRTRRRPAARARLPRSTPPRRTRTPPNRRN